MKNFKFAFTTAAFGTLFAGLVSCSSETATHEHAANETAAAETSWSFSDDSRGIASDSRQKLQRCVERVREAGCTVSGNDMDRVEDNVEACRQVKSGTGNTTLEMFLLKNSGKVIAIKTAGANVSKPNCPKTKYDIDANSGLEEMKIIQNIIWFRSGDGQVYFMHTDGQVYELLNSKHKSYKSVSDIAGADGGKNIVLKFKDGNSFEIDKEKLGDKISDGEVKKINFNYYNTYRSLFRDE